MSVSGIPAGPVTGYVLAGGRSSRMGKDKALVATRDEPLVEFALRTLRQVCGAAAILSGPPDCERDAILSTYGRLVSDRSDGWNGPLAGLAAALTDCTTPYALLLAVDQPGLPVEALQELIQACVAAGAAAACLVHAGRQEPLPLLVSNDLGPAISLALAAGERRLLPTVAAAAAKKRGFVPIHAPSSTDDWFTNLNTPADLHRWWRASGQNHSAQEASQDVHG